MSPQFHRIEEEALLLSLEERELLVERLLRSLQDSGETVIDQSWIAEATHRYRGGKKGQIQVANQDGRPYRIRPFSSGRSFVDDLSNTSKVLAWAEGEDYR